jgi:hypothetical protein
MEKVAARIATVHRTFAAQPPKICDICQGVAQLPASAGSTLRNRANPRPGRRHAAYEAFIPPFMPSLRRRTATPAAQCGARNDLDLPAHVVAAGRLQLPSSSDLFGLWRRGARAFRPVGRRMDDAGAAIALSALGHLGNRQRAADKAPGRAMVCAVAVRALARGQRAVKHRLSREPEKASRLLDRLRPRVPWFVPHRFGNRGGRSGLDIPGLAGGQPDR